MDLLELLQTITREAYDASQPTDLQIGTVVKAPPDDELEIRVSEAMAPLKSAVLYLAEPVIEKKLPLLKKQPKPNPTSQTVCMARLNLRLRASTPNTPPFPRLLPAMCRPRTSKDGRTERCFR